MQPQVAAATEERLVRSTRPSLLTATVGPWVLSRLDDGSGCSSPERLIALWTEEGIRNSRDILQVSLGQGSWSRSRTGIDPVL